MNFRLLITAIVFTISAPQGATTFAAEVDKTDTPQERSEEALPADEFPAEASSETTASSDVFIPTEDISEDFAVSFPVDI